MKKNVLMKLGLLALMAVLTLACTKDREENQKKVAVLLPDASVVGRWATDKLMLEAVMGRYGFETAFYIAPETQSGAEQQVGQLRDAIDKGFKYIVLTAIDYNKINQSGLLRQHPEVRVVCHDRFVLDNPYIAYISSTDTREVGRTQAMFLLNHFHSTGEPSMTIEFLGGPETDINAKDYFEGAMELLSKYFENGKLIARSGKKTYDQIKSASWNVADGKSAMLDRLASYGAGERPDMVLAANDNLAQGAIEALAEKGITDLPVITGQDNTDAAKTLIREGKQTMTLDKNLKDMAYNTALIINSLISGAPVQAGQSVTVGPVNIPVFYSKVTLVTIDSL